MGLLPLLALVASADAVRRFHAARGLSPEDSASGLRDLGQQVAVHRRTYGEFGLHTQGWLVGRLVRGVLLARPARRST